jgi:hypothetical protein
MVCQAAKTASPGGTFQILSGPGTARRYSFAKLWQTPAMRCSLAVAAFLCIATVAAGAQGTVEERQFTAAPDRDSRFGVFIDTRPDCSSGPLPAIRLVAPPAHGNVIIKRGAFKATNFRQCLAVEVPALIAFYHAAADFSGTDEFELEITFAEGRKELQHFRVNVSNNPTGAQSL